MNCVAARDIIQESVLCLVPPPDLLVSDWADERRWVSSRVSSAAGKWSTARTPWTREPMNCFSDPRCWMVVWKKPARMSATEVMLNIIGCAVDTDPCGIFYVQQTDGLGERFSKKILTPTIEETPCLASKFSDRKSRSSDNTILEKSFPGGDLIIVGANSHANFRMISRRIVICDDIDGFPDDVGGEGDPVDLAITRADNDPNKFIFLASSPSIKGASRIDLTLQNSDHRRFKVPCPRCGSYIELLWNDDPKKAPKWLKWPAHRTWQAWYECPRCNGEIKHSEKKEMLQAGRWEAQGEFNGIAGFDGPNKLYSPFMTWGQVIDKYFKAVTDTQTHKVFVNTDLGECWEEVTVEELPTEDKLLARREAYPEEIGEGGEVRIMVPMGGWVLTAAADVQGDRIEVEIVAWGRGEECWSIDYRILWGDVFQPSVWIEYDNLLREQWRHESGAMLRIMSSTTDSGYATDQVYNFVRSEGRQYRRIYAIKGDKENMGAPLVDQPSTKNKKKVILFHVGTYTAKDTIASRLLTENNGPGKMHWPNNCPGKYEKAYFQQLTAEKKYKKVVKGRTVYEWQKPNSSTRNEALDVRVYNHAALGILYNAGFKLDQHCIEMEKRHGVWQPADHGDINAEAAARPRSQQQTPNPQPARSGVQLPAWFRNRR